jgi:hypothetical protein
MSTTADAYTVHTLEDGLAALSRDETALDSIRAAIDRESVVILRHAFPAKLVESAHDMLHRWGKIQPLQPPQTILDENFYTIEQGVSPRQKTLHYYHAYNLNQLRKLPRDLDSGDLQEICIRIFEPMRQFYNAYTGHTTLLDQPDETGMKLHPQAIHYPAGGGHFAAHTHKKSPQEIGLIVHGTRKRRDYQSGSTGFQTKDGVVDTDDLCVPGDMIVFNYGLLHWVTPCELEKALDAQSIAGRWVFVMPYY